jgi:hypothetical protein
MKACRQGLRRFHSVCNTLPSCQPVSTNLVGHSYARYSTVYVVATVVVVIVIVIIIIIIIMVDILRIKSFGLFRLQH